MAPAVAREHAAEAFAEDRPFLWGLLYRMTGDAADAEDLVQETFVRLLRRPPARLDEPLRPWLVRVAMNLGRDHLRRRRRRRYEGPWLPAPLPTGEDEPPAFEPPSPDGGPAARYEWIESLSVAFLLALEALTPRQRAVLLLRDVFDYPVAETAAALEMGAANVKTTHLRARRAMAAYDASRRPPSADERRRNGEVLERFLAGLTTGDVAAVEALLADDVQAVSDSGGAYHASRVPVVGRRNVAALMLGLAKGLGTLTRSDPALLNGLPGMIAERVAEPGFAPKWTFQIELDVAGRIVRLHTVLAPKKLGRVP